MGLCYINDRLRADGSFEMQVYFGFGDGVVLRVEVFHNNLLPQGISSIQIENVGVWCLRVCHPFVGFGFRRELV